MGRWSRIAAVLIIALATPAWAQGHAHGGGPAPIGRPIVGPGVVPNPGQLPYPVFGQPPAGQGGHQHRRGSNGIIAGGIGFDPDLSPSQQDFGPSDDDRSQPPAFFPVAAPRPCAVPPQIIEINGGLRRRAHTRIVYGAPPCR